MAMVDPCLFIAYQLDKVDHQHQSMKTFHEALTVDTANHLNVACHVSKMSATDKTAIL